MDGVLVLRARDGWMERDLEESLKEMERDYLSFQDWRDGKRD